MESYPKTGANGWLREQLTANCLHAMSWLPRDTMKHKQFRKSHFRVILHTFCYDFLHTLESLWAWFLYVWFLDTSVYHSWDYGSDLIVKVRAWFFWVLRALGDFQQSCGHSSFWKSSPSCVNMWFFLFVAKLKRSFDRKQALYLCFNTDNM